MAKNNCFCWRPPLPDVTDAISKVQRTFSCIDGPTLHSWPCARVRRCSSAAPPSSDCPCRLRSLCVSFCLCLCLLITTVSCVETLNRSRFRLSCGHAGHQEPCNLIRWIVDEGLNPPTGSGNFGGISRPGPILKYTEYSVWTTVIL